jgi:hypothetical protein
MIWLATVALILGFRGPSKMSRKYGATTLSMKLMDNFDALLFDCDGVIGIICE